MCCILVCCSVDADSCCCVIVFVVGFVCLSICAFLFFFFFQAEDGIRDLVRSRGLGDVYKRQVPFFAKGGNWIPADTFATAMTRERYRDLLQSVKAVSYTHLTLPTSDLV